MKSTTRKALAAALVGAMVTFNLSAEVIARYDAGVGDGPPPVSPDQYNFNGRTWTAVLNTNANVTVGPISSDLSYCVNAWNVSDDSTGAGLNVTYSFPLEAADRASAASNGWEFTVVSRIPTNFSGSASAFIQVGDTNTNHRFLILLTIFSSGTLSMQLVGTNGANTAFAQGTNYHTHKLVYSPATGTVKYYVDWQLVRSGWTGDYSTNTIDGPAFGASSGSGKGGINFHRVEFGVQPPGPVATAIHYIQVGPDAEHTTLQWDAASNPGGPGLKEYVVYRNDLEVQRSPATTFSEFYLLPCHEYEFTVVAVDTNGTAYAPSLPFPVTSLPSVPVTGVRKLKVLLYNFPDFPGEPFTTNDANDLMFNSTGSVKAYFLENSYGRLTWQGDTAGWYTMPHSISNYCLSTNSGLWYDCGSFNLTQDAFSVLPPDQTNNLGTYDNYVMIFQGVGTAGKAAGFYKLISATWGFQLSVIAHEMGHLLDRRGDELQHAAGWEYCPVYPVGPDLLHPNNTVGTIGRYTDIYDVMGAGNSFHLSMHHKEMLGFLLPSNIQTADHDGDYDLYAAEVPTNAVQMLKIPLDHEMFYFFEYRTKQGFDGPGTPQQYLPPIDGVLVRLRVALAPGADADTLWPNIVLNPGTNFLDPYRGLRVEVKQKLGDHVVVNVSGIGKPLKLTDLKLTGVVNQDVQLTYDSVTGAKYFIQSSTNLTSWLTEQTNVLAGSASTTNVLPGAGAATKRFFRVGVDATP